MPAIDVLPSVLDETGTAVPVGDWDTYRNPVDLPFTLITETATTVVATEDDLRKGLDSFYHMLRFQMVTQDIQLAESAVAPSDMPLPGLYDSHFTAGSQRITPPFRSAMAPRPTGNGWQGVAITNPLSNMQWPIQVPRVDQPLKGADE